MGTRPYRDDFDKIPAGARLIRRIPPALVEWGDVDPGGNPHVKSAAMQMLDKARAARFGCPGPGMSVIIESLSDPIPTLIDRYHKANGEGLAYIEEGLIRCDELGVDHWPTEEEPAHGVVFRFDGGKKMPGRVRKALATYAQSHFIVHPRR